jgi:hypothetical protein
MKRFGSGILMILLVSAAGLAGCVFPSDDGSQTGEESAALNGCGHNRHRCGGVCVSNTSLMSCGNSCVACPVPANGVATCNGTSCAVSCATGFHLCGTVCVSDTINTVTSCGRSCTACTAPANAVATCNAGTCGFFCNAGFHLSGGSCVSNLSP